MNKYELLKDDVKDLGYAKLYRVKYLKDIPRYCVKSGDLGGYIESESNLSHKDDCVVLDNAHVYGNAWVSDNALVSDNARVSGDALVYGNARVFNNAQVSGNALVSGDAKVYGDAHVSGNAQVFNNAQVYGDAKVYGDAHVKVNPTCITGLRHTITITETHIFIGCEGHTIEHWKKNIVKIGKANGYTDKEIKRTIRILKAHLS